MDDTIVRNLKRTKEKETSEDYGSLRYENEKKRRKLWFQNQYTNNDQFRRRILSRRKVEYICQKEKKLNKLKIKYKEMENYRSKLRKLNRDNYKMNEKHRENLKKNSEKSTEQMPSIKKKRNKLVGKNTEKIRSIRSN